MCVSSSFDAVVVKRPPAIGTDDGEPTVRDPQPAGWSSNVAGIVSAPEPAGVNCTNSIAKGCLGAQSPLASLVTEIGYTSIAVPASISVCT